MFDTLSEKFSDAFKFTYTDEDGKKKPVIMGCYGIGPSRVVGSVAEVHADENGLSWPKSVAPFNVHLVSLISKDAKISLNIPEFTSVIPNEKLELLYVFKLRTFKVSFKNVGS